MKNWFRMPVAAHLLLKRDDTILLLLREGTNYEDGKYSVVAGHLDGNESGTDAMIREAKEEAGIDIKQEWLEFACVIHRKAPDRESIDFFYVCTRWNGEIRNMEPHKCSELRFVPEAELPENTVEYVRAGIYASTKGTKYLEFGW